MQQNTPIFQYLFPKYCAGCGLPSQTVCEKCLSKMFRELPTCYLCGRLNSGYKAHERCIKDSNSTVYGAVICLWRHDTASDKIYRAINERYISNASDVLFKEWIKRNEMGALSKVFSLQDIKVFKNGFTMSSQGNKRDRYLIVSSSIEGVEKIRRRIVKDNNKGEIFGVSLFGIDKTKLTNKI